MSLRLLRSLSALAIAIAVATLTVLTVHAQAPAAKARPAAAKWTVPRTPDGRPDLQGNWNNNSVTPLQRPPQLSLIHI